MQLKQATTDTNGFIQPAKSSSHLDDEEARRELSLFPHLLLPDLIEYVRQLVSNRVTNRKRTGAASFLRYASSNQLSLLNSQRGSPVYRLQNPTMKE